MFSNEDEVLRSKIWNVVMTVSSLLIVVIAAFFLIKMFRSNPLEGTWRNEESDIVLTIKGNGSMTADIPEILEGEGMKLKLGYTLDKDEKTISIEADESVLEKAAGDSDVPVTAEMLESALGSLLTTFDYSVDQDELTLTEREYGEQLVLIKE